MQHHRSVRIDDHPKHPSCERRVVVVEARPPGGGQLVYRIDCGVRLSVA